MNVAPSMAAHTSGWFTSSYSNGAGGECVECARGVDSVLVRDSKETCGPVVAFRSHPWRAFIRGLEGDRRSAVRPG
ncbi:DUF397 domain-containing protein [Streptomyces sp. NBC_01176]|uniref:DUF397 domain-containing protein n=1 Tax=Streptomyces sp. NBC_01176 TaxID=2903760 RepID=UPI003869C8FE|nr:DUF397 domain-containing protein [Streptomyces sp. NBC_01176]